MRALRSLRLCFMKASPSTIKMSKTKTQTCTLTYEVGAGASSVQLTKAQLYNKNSCALNLRCRFLALGSDQCDIQYNVTDDDYCYQKNAGSVWVTNQA